MDKIALAKKEQRKAVFLETAHKAHLESHIVEKDFWVSWALGKIFADANLNKILCFKGGTSLSKIFGLIERFSEDIDLILAQSTVIKEDEELYKSSNSKQAAFNTVIEGRAGLFISGELKEMIRKVISPVCQIEEDETDKHVLHIIFPRLFDYGYIQPTIKLEIGPLALWNPHEQYQIDSFVGKYLPELELSKPIITTIKPERTFWEKITILHHEAHRPIGSAVPVRYSRHYYDIYKMGHTYVKTEALQNLDILKEVILFKKRFYPRGWAKYDEAVPGTMKLIPSSASIKVLEDDYSKMKRMIYGEVPDWNDIVKYLSELENEINNL